MKSLLPLLLGIGVLVCAAGCAKKTPQAQGAFPVVAGDTLSPARLVAIRPDSLDPARKLAVVTAQVRFTEVQKRNGRTVAPDVAEEFQSQLSLRSGTEWSKEAAVSLLGAAAGLKSALDSAVTPEAVEALLDTLRSYVPPLVDSVRAEALKTEIFASRRNKASRKALEELVAAVFSIGQTEAALIVDFLESEGSKNGDDDSAAMKKLVAGLVYDASAKPAGSAGKPDNAAVIDEPADNSEQVLRFRPLPSIADSIARRQPDITAIYKKALKTHPDIRGNVTLRLRVNPAGAVVKATCAASQIPAGPFIDSLCAYVQSIQFMPVPGSAGYMTFEFPFAFSPEE